MEELYFTTILYAVVEPSLGLVVTRSVGYSDVPDDLISLRYEPEISPGQITIPPSDFDKRSWARLNATAAPEKIIASDRSLPVTDVKISVSVEGESLDITVLNSAQEIGLKSSVVDRVLPGSRGRGRPILLESLAKSINLPDWDRAVDEENAPIVRIRMWIASDALEAPVGSAVDCEQVDGLSKLVEREVRR